MPAESIKSDPPVGSEAKALPKKKPVISGRAALAKITLLDGSILDVSIDVSSSSSCRKTRLIVISVSIFREKQRERI